MSTPTPMSRLPQRQYLPPEPAPGNVISWRQQFTPGGAICTYVAVHVEDRGWFVSDENEAPYSWPALIYWLIGVAPIFIATAWSSL